MMSIPLLPFRLRSLFLILLLVGLGVPLPLQAQSVLDRNATEQRLRELREQISLDEERLSATSRAERSTSQNLMDLDREMVLRHELISNYQTRMAQLTMEYDSLRLALSGMEEELGVIKKQYRGRAIHAYKYGRLHDLALILSASSINQMLVRVRYLTRFTDQRKSKLDRYATLSRTLEDRRTALAEAKVQTQLLLREAEDQRKNILRLQQSRKQVINKLQSQKDVIQGEIAKKRAAAIQFETSMRTSVTAETARRRERVASNPQAEVEYQGLTGSFLNNRGKLPWPSRGVVVEPFGDIVNPIHGTKTPNPGILIATKPQAEVSAIFDGTVLRVSVMPEFGTWVLVQHGAYQSVYSNFSMVYVTEGQQIKAGQVIGRAGTDDEPKQAGIFFGLFKDGESFNPVPWLRPQ